MAPRSTLRSKKAATAQKAESSTTIPVTSPSTTKIVNPYATESSAKVTPPRIPRKPEKTNSTNNSEILSKIPNYSPAMKRTGVKQEPGRPEKRIVLDLAKLGTKPSLNVPKIQKKKYHLHLTALPDLNDKGEKTDIVLARFTMAQDRNTKQTSEAGFHVAVKSKYMWTKDLNFTGDFYAWCVNGVPQMNARGYRILLYPLAFDPGMKMENYRYLGTQICAAITEYVLVKDREEVILPEDFFWLTNPVWADVIGPEQAEEKLLSYVGEADSDDFYVKNFEVIHYHFKHGTLSKDLAQKLRAPHSEIHPDERDGAFSDGTEILNGVRPYQYQSQNYSQEDDSAQVDSHTNKTSKTDFDADKKNDGELEFIMADLGNDDD